MSGARAQAAYLLRHALPLFLVQLVGDLLPDTRATMALRGRLAAPFLASCGPNLQLGRDVTLLGCDHLHVGRDVYLAKGSWVNAGGGLTIGDEVMFGPYVVVSTSTHQFADGSARFAGWKLGPVEIGRGSWIAAHSTVTAGVTIGAGCLVAAGAVVTEDVPAATVVGGVPARALGPVTDGDADVMSRLGTSTSEA